MLVVKVNRLIAFFAANYFRFDQRVFERLEQRQSVVVAHVRLDLSFVQTDNFGERQLDPITIVFVSRSGSVFQLVFDDSFHGLVSLVK